MISACFNLDSVILPAKVSKQIDQHSHLGARLHEPLGPERTPPAVAAISTTSSINRSMWGPRAASSSRPSAATASSSSSFDSDATTADPFASPRRSLSSSDSSWIKKSSASSSNDDLSSSVPVTVASDSPSALAMASDYSMRYLFYLRVCGVLCAPQSRAQWNTDYWLCVYLFL